MGRLRIAPLIALPLFLAGAPGWNPELKAGFDAAEQGLWREAAFRYNRALEKSRAAGGEDPRVLNNLAVTAEASGEFARARELYERALALAPDDQPLKDNFTAFKSYSRKIPGLWPELPPAPAPAPAAAPEPGSAPAPQPQAGPEPAPGSAPGASS